VIPRAPILLLDELQRMPARARRRLLREGRPLAIASHEDHGHELAQAGYSVEVRRLTGGDVAHLTDVVERRIEASRRGPGEVPRVTAASIERLHARCGGDVRAALDVLYDRFQTVEGPHDVEV
jgi:hypothetical protein